MPGDRARDWSRRVDAERMRRMHEALGGIPPQERSRSPFGPGASQDPLAEAFEAGMRAGYAQGWEARGMAMPPPPADPPAGVDWGLLAKVLALAGSPVEGEADAARRKLVLLLRQAFPEVRRGP